MTGSVTDPVKLIKGVFSVLSTLWTRFNNVPAIEVSGQIKGYYVKC